MEDTIVAISTSQGIGAISIIRLSGKESIEIVNKIVKNKNLNKLNSHTINYNHVVNNDEIIDEVLISIMKAPRSFTTEDVVEINCHGGIATTNKILELLTSEKKVEVSQLAEYLDVSQVTVRKDLDALEAKGIIKREHGYAVLCSADDINGRIAYHYEEKKKIALKAAELVSEGDTIMIESGSCCALLADTLTQLHKDLTIITNSAFIAAYIRGKSNFQIILLGGIYQQDSQVMVGPMVQECVSNFFVDYFFIGTDGYDSKIGFSSRDQMRAQAVRDMSHQAEQIIVLTESDKFSKRGVVPLNLKNKVKTVITDHSIDSSYIEELNNQNIQIIKV